MAKKPLREYMDGKEFYYVPEIFDCISTRAAEMNGFQMVMISSSDFACSQTVWRQSRMLVSASRRRRMAWKAQTAC